MTNTGAFPLYFLFIRGLNAPVTIPCDHREGVFCYQKMYNTDMRTTQKRKFGNIGEKLAAEYLRNKGYQIIETNYQNRNGIKIGEIDIIAKEKDELVFVEVKTREMKKYQNTLPEENITYRKIKKMNKTANIYLSKEALDKVKFRFDAISVWLDLDNKKAKIKHIMSL